MRRGNISLEEAVRFHGHLGPFLVLGLRIGDLAIKRLGAKRHFGVFVRVKGASKRPKSCLIDGLQLATGATFGKGNIDKIPGPRIIVSIKNLKNKTKIVFRLKKELSIRLDRLKTHEESEKMARILFKSPASELFEIN